MGTSTSKQLEYATFIGEKIPGETQVLRNPDINTESLYKAPNDCNTIWKAFDNTVRLHPDRPFMGTRKILSENKLGEYQFRTYREAYYDVRKLAAGMILNDLLPEISTENHGVFKFLGLYSRNRYEWIITDLAGHLNSATAVTFYDTLGEATIEYILNQTQLTTIATESKSLNKLIALKKESKTGNLKNIILFDSPSEKDSKEAEEAGLVIYTYTQLIEAGTNKEVTYDPAKPETVATFCYTSGTTGNPKGAMLTHSCILSDIASLEYTDCSIYETDVYLSFLPLAHVMERLVFTACFSKGIAIGFFSGNPLKLMEDAQLLKPTIFVGVPRIFQRVYASIMDGIEKLGSIKKALAKRAIRNKLEAYRKTGALTNMMWDRLVFARSKNSLGGNVRLMLTGSAPIAPDMLEFLKIAFCCPIVEGYGATETCGCATLTKMADTKSGHVGGLFPVVEMKLVDCESLNYKSTDVDSKGNPTPRGEICFRGNIIFSGYFNDKENTEKAIDKDGWLHTGDVGMIMSQHGNALKIIDRVKNIFKLSQGEYIAPEKLENILIKSKYVLQVFVHGESVESTLVAIVVPKKSACVEFLNGKGVDCTEEDVEKHFKNEDLIKDVLNDMSVNGKKNDFKGFEIIKKCYLSNEPFSVDNGMLTPTMKLKRNEAKQKYTKEIQAMYAK